MNCLLCAQPATLLHTKVDKVRGELHYYYCSTNCELIFLDPAQRVSEQDEKARYDTHNNNPEEDNAGYVEFLQRLTAPLISILNTQHETERGNKESSIGLDFGCGPETALSQLMQQAGYTMKNYDPFYFPDNTLLEEQYHFITMCEVAEHLYDPFQVFTQLHTMLKPGGYLGIMTETVTSPDKFANWWYHRDKTHVVFYSPATFEWLAKQFNWRLLELSMSTSKNVTIFKQISKVK